MVIGRGGVLLRGEKRVKVGLLFGRLAEDQRDGRQGDAGVQRAEIVLGLRQRVNVPIHPNALRVPNLTFDEARLSADGAGENTSDEKGPYEAAMHRVQR